jgi:hypothetical protein
VPSPFFFVKRNGELLRCQAEDIMVGDVVALETGACVWMSGLMDVHVHVCDVCVCVCVCVCMCMCMCMCVCVCVCVFMYVCIYLYI